MEVRIKKLNPNAVLPKYSKAGDAGMDMVAMTRLWDSDTRTWTYGTGLVVEIPKGYVGLLFPRSSIYKYDVSLCNAVGVLDSGYRGEVTFKFRQTNNTLLQHKYEVDDRIGQLVILPYPEITFKEVADLTETERGSGGYGSTGRK
jgi:dUTP pyrophosphatase